MKKVLLTAAAAFTMFAMVACCNNKPAEEPAVEEAAVEQCEHKCMHEGDSAMCCKAEGAAEEHACCAKEGEHKCMKAEGTECCKKAEGKECEHKCEKAQ